MKNPFCGQLSQAEEEKATPRLCKSTGVGKMYHSLRKRREAVNEKELSEKK